MAEIRFFHVDEVEPMTALPQLHGERRAAVHLHIFEQSPERFFSHTRYDPGYVVERHTHAGDQLIYVLSGDLAIGGRECPPGTAVVLPAGAPIGPIAAGPRGAHILEIFAGLDATHAEPVDAAETRRLFESLGIEPLFDVDGPRGPEE